ncbi:MAG TPA: STAS domain-containing protein, partial [Ilumatobacteraceae bacterium]
MDEDLLEVRIASVDNWFLVTVHGEIDASTVITFRAALEQVPASDTVVVNLANVRFLDSSGLGVLA